MKEQLLGKIKDRSAVVGIVGLGYVGLPLAMEFAKAGFRVIGYDVSKRTVDALMGGTSHIQDVPSSEVAEQVQAGRFEATAVEARLADSPPAARRLLAAAPQRDEDADALARVTRCRSVDARGRWSARPPDHDGDAWHRRWAARGHAYGVVYGHWSQQGLHVAPGLRGLDSGCVYHGGGRDGFLTAWLPARSDPAPFRTPDHAFWQIPARARYWKGP